MPFVMLSGHRIEYQDLPATRPGTAPLLLLHEGLGSIALWRDFPAKLAAATGCRTLVYSRWGYGGSAPLAAPRKLDYMHREALEDLPALRQALGLNNPILVGHSDGASIALIHAGAGKWPVRALIVEAPHVFVEDISIKGIRDAKIAYDGGELKRRLARYHDDVEDTFRGWNDVWLSPEFRGWNIEEYLAGIACPILALQGRDDEYGTLAQLDAVGNQVKSSFERLVLPNSRHSPHRDQERAVLEAMARFIARV
ncbi:MAG TPA: alpha/beta hydrolase [Stellaceae bacterium]|nr:alpha/beta hydrolase [Stellaceae bacterium]